MWPDWSPSGNPPTGWFQMQDTLLQSGIWIDTGTKQGVVYGVIQGRGQLTYNNSDLVAQQGGQSWLIYDPADLARAAQGTLAHNQIIPVEYDIQYPHETYPLGGWRGHLFGDASAFTYDETTKRLYVGIPEGWRSGSNGYMLVHCYQVS
jgi:hypothetical protein